MMVSGGFVRTIPMYLLVSTLVDDLNARNIDAMASESDKFRCRGSEKLLLPAENWALLISGRVKGTLPIATARMTVATGCVSFILGR